MMLAPLLALALLLPAVAGAHTQSEFLDETDLSKNFRTKGEIMTVVYQQMPDLRSIYKQYLEQKPGFSGKVIVKLTIAPSGEVTSINIVSSTTDFPEFDNAVKNTVQTWKWKANKGGDTMPTIPFNFSEE